MRKRYKLIIILTAEMKGISCIIPVFNEAGRISEVISVLKGHPLIDEIIIVNDGSTDNTSKIIKRFKSVRLIEYEHNKGKAMAMITGVEHAKYDIVLFLDADLINLTQKNIELLVKPLLDRKTDMTIGLIICYPVIDTLWNVCQVNIISGIRCLKKEIIKKMDINEKIGYGIEMLMNEYFIKNNLRFAIVKLDNMKFPFAIQKFGLWKGLRKEIRMWIEIFKVVPPHKAIAQLYFMTKRKKRYDELYTSE